MKDAEKRRVCMYFTPSVLSQLMVVHSVQRNMTAVLHTVGQDNTGFESPESDSKNGIFVVWYRA